MNTNFTTSYVPTTITMGTPAPLALNMKTIRSSSAIQSQISPITHKDKLEQQVLYSHTPSRMQYSSSVDNLQASYSASKEQPIFTKYPLPFTTNLNGIPISTLTTTGAIIQDHNYRLEQKESPYGKLNPLLTETNPPLHTDLDLRVEREKNLMLDRQINELKREIKTLKNRLGTRDNNFIRTDDDNELNLDNLKSSNNFNLNLNVSTQQACAQFVMLCAENERLTYAYLQKEKEVVNLQNEILQLKSNVLLEQTKQSQYPFAQQLDIEAKLKVFEMRNESLHQQKLELQNKEYDYLQQIERLSQMNMLKEQQISKMQSENNISCIEVQNLNEQINVIKRQYAELKDTYEKQSNNLAQLDFQKLQASQNTLILTEKETIIFQKNQEIAEFKNYISMLEKDVQQLQEKFNQESRKQMTVTGKYDQLHQDLQQKYENHIQLHNQLKEQFEFTENELLKTQGHCELILSENEKLSYALKARIEENEALKEEIKIQSTVQINYEESQTMINELKDNIDKLLEDNKKLYEVNRQMNAQSDSNQNDLMSLEQNFAEREKQLLNQINELESKSVIMIKQLEQKNMDDNEYELKNRNTEKNFKEIIFENEKLKSMVEIKDIKIKELQFSVEEMQMEHMSLQQTKQEYQLLLVRSKELDKKMLTLQEECNSWKVKYSAIESHQASVIEELKFKVKNSTKEEYEREITWIKAKLEANESQKDQLMVKLASYEQKAIMNEHSLKDLREKYANKTEEYDHMHKEFNDRKQKADVLEKQYYSMQEKHLLIRIENERLHSVLQQMLKENDEIKRQFDNNLTTNRKQHSEVYARMQEYEEINRNLKTLISEYQDEIAKLEKQCYNLKQSNFKIDEYENKILFLNREYEQIKLRLVESESQKQEFKIKFQESHNSLVNYQQMDQQVSFLTKENERLQKLIMERCRQSNSFW